MKSWGCQASLLHFFPLFFRVNRERLAGGPGGGNERPGLPHDAAKSAAGMPEPTACRSFDLWGCTRLFELRHLPGREVCRPTHRDTPRRPFVRTSSGDNQVSLSVSTQLRADATGSHRSLLLQAACFTTRRDPAVCTRSAGSPAGLLRLLLGIAAPRSAIAQHGPAA